MSFSNKLMLKEWNCTTPITEILSLEGNNLDYKKNYLWKKKRSERDSDTEFSRDGTNEESSTISIRRILCTKIWVMRQYRRSLRKCTKCNIRWFFNDSGEVQDVESNYNGRLSYVPSQWASIPSSRSMLSCDRRLPLDTWNMSGPQENVFGNQFFYSWFVPKSLARNSSFYDTKFLHVRFQCILVQGLLSQEYEDLTKGTITMPTFARKPSTTSSLLPVDIPQNSVVGQQIQQISELQSDKFPHPQWFLVWKMRFKNQVTTCSDFPSEATLWIKEVEKNDSLEELKSSRSLSKKKIFQILRC